MFDRGLINPTRWGHLLEKLDYTGSSLRHLPVIPPFESVCGVNVMLARRVLSVATKRPMRFATPVSMRSFSDEQLTIPTDKEQQGGRRKEELDAAERGEIGFDHRSSLVPPDDAGTKENPIMVCADNSFIAILPDLVRILSGRPCLV